MPRNRTAFYHSRGFALLSVFFGICLNAAAQSSSTIFRTGGGVATVTEVRELTFPADPQTRIRVDFGFTTDESPSVGSFHDSFTATLQRADQSATAIYFTIDPLGVQWAPLTPGTIGLAANSIQRSAIAFPAPEAALAFSTSFSMSAPIPNEFLGQTVDLYFDLFDNQDAVNSAAAVGPVTIVPEPRILILLSVFVLFVLKRDARSEKS